ncbi:hypothetical protein B0H14DRAFT_2932037 [Mycena olivaceomarginata]|nr:hypothetical protein B0H14DRAFT_2932037 [Mycena olivaceomarginata]
MKEQLASQVFSLLSLILIPFIPDSTLRYIALALVFISIAAYLVYQNTLTRQVGRLDAAAKEVNTLFEAATAECVADPRFVYETGLKLTEYDPHIGTGTLADDIQAELRGVDPAFTNPQYAVYVMEGIRVPSQSHRVIHRGMSARTGRVAVVDLESACFSQNRPGASIASRTKRRSVRKAKRTPSSGSSTSRPAADGGAYRGDGVPRGNTARGSASLWQIVCTLVQDFSAAARCTSICTSMLSAGTRVRGGTMLHVQQRHVPRRPAADEGAYRGDGVPRGEYRMWERVAVANAH